MGLRIEDANRDLSEYKPLLSMIVDLSKKAKLSYTDLPFVIDFLDKLYNDKNKKIAELEHRLSNCIELPQGIDVGKTVYYVTEYCNEEGDELYEIEVGLIHWIEKSLRVSDVQIDKNGMLKEIYNGFNYTIYVRYESGLTFQHGFEDVGVWLFATEEEAKAKLRSLQDDNN